MGVTSFQTRRSKITTCEYKRRDPNFNPLEKAWDLSFSEELHAIDAVIGGQGVAICSDVVVSNELRSGQLVKVHPLALPGYGFYLVSMPHSPQAPVIEAFSTWMRAIS